MDSGAHDRHAAGTAAADRASLKENKTGEKPHTVRELMALHRDKPSCFACHGVMDPLGFALENFDAVGEWRTKDRIAGTAIDASGELPDGTKINGPIDLRNALASNPNQFVQTLTEKLMTYATGSRGRLSRHADGPRHRARQREGRLSVLDDRDADREQRPVPEAHARERRRSRTRRRLPRRSSSRGD